ncbi:MAG: TfoX/Sxy family protein [Leptolinea sp.]|jgi:TfoX/Sxy family transcriptional regulator of competence genes|nr:TfoX/Sxy family protein [Leptolinea sp.]
MTSSQDTIDYLIEQMSGAGVITARKMFGEYGMYCDGKIIALVCDDQFFLKPTAAARAYLGDGAEEAPPYPGAKMYLHISGEKWDDSEWLSELIRVSMPELPEPKKKK